MAPALDIAGLLSLLHAGETVLLPTPRAARALRDRFDRLQRTRGLRAWEPPRILTWSEWTQSLWNSLLLNGYDDRALLNSVQEEALWAGVVAATPEGGRLPAESLRAITGLAASALELAAAHLPLSQLQVRLRSAADTSDSRAFASWQAALSARAGSERLLPRALLDGALAQHIVDGRVCGVGPLHLAGFARLTPRQTTLLAAWERQGRSVHRYNLVQPRGSTIYQATVRLPDPQEELHWAVRWIAERFRQDRRDDLALALLLPDPAAERAALEPLLREVLAPELDRVETDLSSTPWHFSAGPPLARLPLIEHALLLLRWSEAELPMDEVGRLLLSPFLFQTDSLETRARFEMHMRDSGGFLRPALTLRDTLRLVRHSRFEPPLSLAELHRLEGAITASGDMAGSRSHGDWAELTRKLLRAAGWPGPRALSATEFRATEAWNGVLDLLTTLDLYGQRLRFPEFLRALEHQAGITAAPEPSETALLRIARLQDVEGCLLDSVLVLRSTEQALPPPERPHPLLGWGLQHDLGLPGVDADATHQRSREALLDLQRRAGDLLLTCAAQDETGNLRPSPLARDLGLDLRPAASILAPEEPEEPLAAVRIDDTVPLPPLPEVHVHGGADVLRLQGACGFRAFAALRLQARAPEAAALGMDPRERGKLLHGAMERLWSDLQTQNRLRSMAEPARLAAVQHAVASAFEKFQAKQSHADPWSAAYLEILQARLVQLIHDWLACELRRGDFSVSRPEQQQSIHVGPLEMSVRPDRIDRVTDGVVIVDYKTTQDLKTDQWLGARPEAPQLPLYALLVPEGQLRGLAFARMRTGKDMGWISLEDQPGLFPGRKNKPLQDLEAELEHWRDELTRLAQAFYDGRAEVNPKEHPGTCQYCEHRLLCRVNPLELGTELERQAGAEERSHG